MCSMVQRVDSADYTYMTRETRLNPATTNPISWVVLPFGAKAFYITSHCICT
jgi:hypothetical protein